MSIIGSIASNTKVVKFDGSIVPVNELVVGDQIMGDDSTVRTVTDISHNEDRTVSLERVKGEPIQVGIKQTVTVAFTELARISLTTPKTVGFPVKHRAYWVVFPYNKKQKVFDTRDEAEDHLKTLSTKGMIVDFSAAAFHLLSVSAKLDLKLSKTAIDFPSREVLFDKYVIGFWIGDGASDRPAITCQDATILHKIVHLLPKYDLCLRFHAKYAYRIISCSSNNKGKNVFLTALRTYSLLNNKHIPPEYLYNDRATRLEVLSGLIDSDGYRDVHCYEITQKNKRVAEDIVFLGRSLGFGAYMYECTKWCMYKGEKRSGTYFRTYISGPNLHEVPVVVPRKKISADPRASRVKDPKVSGFKLVDTGTTNPCTSIVVDGNHRFVLGDFTVVHDATVPQ